MTPLTDGANAQTRASAAATAMQTTLDEDLRATAQSNNLSAAPAPPDKASESSGKEEDEMVDALEDLILEAYNNMQIDEEYIFLPEHVAEKLHEVAEQLKPSEEEQTENKTVSNSGDKTVTRAKVEEVKVPQQEISTDRLAPENEQKQEKAQVTEAENVDICDNVANDREARLRKVQMSHAKAAELRREKAQHKQYIPQVMSTEIIDTKLASVPEINESASSERSPSPSPPLLRSYSGAHTPKMRTQISAPDRGRSLPPPLISSTSSPSANSDPIGNSSMSRTPDPSGGSKRENKVLTYGTRQEAALRQKEDKKKRELLVRETARKQREDSKRQLEEVHQRESEERRERARRIREARLHRRTGKPTAATGTKKKGSARCL